MSVKSYLQNEYTWKRDSGDSPYAGILDRIKVDKDEGYEVVSFIEGFCKKYRLSLSEENVQLIESKLHLDELSNVQMRDDLMLKIRKEITINGI